MSGRSVLSDSVSAATMSLLIPGAGQWAQGRGVPAVWHFLEVACFSAIAAFDPANRTLWMTLAVGSGLWSVIDAYRSGLTLRASNRITTV